MPLINFLRAKMIEMPGVSVATPVVPNAKEDFKRMVEFYGMTPFVYQQTFQLHRGKSEMVQIVSGPEPSVDCRAFSTFVLIQAGSHGRKLNRLVIVLGESIERPQIGWANFDGYPQATNTAEHKGPGEEGASVALDGFRGGVLCKGAVNVEVDQLALQAGSVVECEKTPDLIRWRVASGWCASC